MIKPLLVCLAVTAAATVSAQQQSDYTNTAERFRTFYNARQADSIFDMMSPQVQQMIPRDRTSALVNQIQGSMGHFNEYQWIKKDANFAYIKSVFDKSTVTMLLGLSGDNKITTFRFVAYKADTVQSNIVLKRAAGNIYGTLTSPPTTAKVPVVLILAGSGPTDRNGNNQFGLSTDTYKQLADSLLKYNIACVRYDKRGVGESAAAGKREDSTSVDDFVDDAAGLIKMLKQDVRFSKVIVAGHSEGSLEGMVAAGREHADGFISIAGAGYRIDKVIEEQYAAQSAELGSMATKAFDSIKRGYTVSVSNPALAQVFHNSAQPFLRSWLQYDPQKEIKKLKQPVLILQGTHDIQVAIKDAEALHKAAPSAKLVMLDGMSHILKAGPTDRQKNMATYSDATLPLFPGLVPQIVSFIEGK